MKSISPLKMYFAPQP